MTVRPIRTHGTPATAQSSSPSRLKTRDLRLAYDSRVVIDNLDLDVLDNTVTAVIGPNGCGKSTLVRALARLMRPRNGAVLLDGTQIHQRPTREVARTLGVLPQEHHAPEGLTVAELVARGRYPHQLWYRRWSTQDQEAINQALRLTGMQELADSPLDELSGGQRQRAWISMVLAQGTEMLLLDEPTTHLDLAHQVEILELVAELHTRSDKTVVMVLHDVNAAARYAQRLLVMREGRIVAEGPPTEVLTEELLREVFDLDARVIPHPVTNTPLVAPVGVHRHHDASEQAH